jgi:hypothetical protein
MSREITADLHGRKFGILLGAWRADGSVMYAS